MVLVAEPSHWPHKVTTFKTNFSIGLLCWKDCLTVLMLGKTLHPVDPISLCFGTSKVRSTIYVREDWSGRLWLIWRAHAPWEWDGFCAPQVNCPAEIQVGGCETSTWRYQKCKSLYEIHSLKKSYKFVTMNWFPYHFKYIFNSYFFEVILLRRAGWPHTHVPPACLPSAENTDCITMSAAPNTLLLIWL